MNDQLLDLLTDALCILIEQMMQYYESIYSRGLCKEKVRAIVKRIEDAAGV